MKKWGMGVVALTTFLGVAGLCGTGCSRRQTEAEWFESWCSARTRCPVNACNASGAELETRYTTVSACKSKLDAFRACKEQPDLCGSGDGCGAGFQDEVLLPCFCGNNLCEGFENSFSCPADCGSS
jgi:hypothetical protein